MKLTALARACYETLNQQSLETLEQISSLAQNTSPLKQILSDKSFSEELKLMSLQRIFPTLSEDHNLKNLCNLLAQKKSLHLLLQLSEFIRKIQDKKENTPHLKITTAKAISKEQQQELRELLSNNSNDIEINIDESLIAGVKIQSDEYIIDASFQGYMQRMKQYILNH